MIFTHPRCLQCFPTQENPNQRPSTLKLRPLIYQVSLSWSSSKNMKNEALNSAQTPRHCATLELVTVQYLILNPASCHVAPVSCHIFIVPRCLCIVPRFFQWQPPKNTPKIVSRSHPNVLRFFQSSASILRHISTVGIVLNLENEMKMILIFIESNWKLL